MHRRHHAGRVPQVHREGRRAGAPLPAGHGRRADPSTRRSTSCSACRERYEAHHHVKMTDEALRSAVDLSVRYVADRALPDKAIDLIDEAGSRVRLRNASAAAGDQGGAEEPGRGHPSEGRSDRRAGLRGCGRCATRRRRARSGSRSCVPAGTRRPPRTSPW